MRVLVRLFGDFRRYATATGNRTDHDLPDGTSVQGLLDRLGIPDDEAGLVAVNGWQAAVETELHDGDRVDVFSPIGGGNERSRW